MKRMIMLVMAGLFLTAGCAAMMSIEEREKTYGKEPAVIAESFASKQMRPGDTWKVYLKASDPNRDMQYVVATILQPGMGMYPMSFTKIKEENGKELSGYVYLNTMGPDGYTWQNFLSITLTIQIKDKAGHFSQPVVFPLSFQDRYAQEPAPSGVFKEQDLGPIMIVLRHPDGDQGGGDGFF